MDIALLIDNIEIYKNPFVNTYLEGWGNKSNGIANAMKQLKELVQSETKISMLYFGNEFCEYRLPRIIDLEKFISICTDNQIKPVFVTPMVSDRGMEHVKECLRYLSNFNIEVEIVVNDVGVLEFVHRYYPKLSIALGRVFDKTSHDSRALDKDINGYYGTEGLKFARTPGILSAETKNAFNRYNIKRYEFDLPIVGINLPKEGNFSLYWPYQYLTTGRVCLLRSFYYNEDEKFLVGNYVCPQICKNLQIEMRKPINGFQINEGKKVGDFFLFQRGNTLFYLYERDFFVEEISQFDRIILQV